MFSYAIHLPDVSTFSFFFYVVTMYLGDRLGFQASDQWCKKRDKMDVDQCLARP